MVSSRPSDYDGGSVDFDERAKVKGPELGIKGWLRWFWRQLTSMRVALLLLLMLAIATIPGSLFPQRGADPNGVALWQQDNPDLFKVLDAFPLQMFDVYGSVWFSSIYLLLFISLVGCVLPRLAQHWKALRSAPPKTPARLTRMAGFSSTEVTNENASDAEKLEFAQAAVARGEQLLKKQGYRTVIEERTFRGRTEISVSAERGYARETGNLVFHIGLLGVLVAIGVNGAFNFHGQKVLIEGEAAMVNALIDYDTATSGTYFDDNSLDAWGMRLDNLEIDYVTPEDANQNAVGQVLEHRAFVTMFPADGSASKEELVRVNHPLRFADSSIYLLANGYAPVITIHNAEGKIVHQEPVVFIPQDTNMTSLGIIKVSDGMPEQLGLRGFFYPTKAELDTGALTSSYPDLNDPVLTLDVFEGDLGINEGIPQSVYALDTSEMEQLTGRAVDKDSLELTLGETVDLPNGLGTISMDSVPRYVGFDVLTNPAQTWILVSALAATAGLIGSIFVPRRRMWVKAIPNASGVTFEYAALARGDDPTLERAVEDFKTSHREEL